MRPDKPRIIMASAQAYPLLGGVESHIDQVAGRLVAQGFRIELYSTDRSGALPRRAERNGAQVHRFRAWPAARDYFASPGLFLGLLRADFDLLHVQGIHTLVPPTAMLAAILRRKPFVVTFHTGGHSRALRNRMRRRQFRALAPMLRRASALIAVSGYEARIFADVLDLPAERITLIRNGGIMPPKQHISVVDDLIVSVGRLERYKGHHRAIEALPHVLAQRPNARLRILGSGPYESELHAIAARLGVSDRVSIDFIPPQQRDAMAAALSEAAVVSLLSDYESHPVAITEAIGLGRPVVALDNSGVSELVELKLVRGLRQDSPPGETAAALVAELAAQPSRTADPQPTWSDCARQLSEVYRSVLNQCSGGRYQAPTGRGRSRVSRYG